MPDTPLERPDTTPTTPGQPAPGAWETLVRLWNMLKALIGDVGKLDDKVDSGFGDLNDKVDSGLEDLDGKINSTNDSLKDALDKITSQGGSITEILEELKRLSESLKDTSDKVEEVGKSAPSPVGSLLYWPFASNPTNMQKYLECDGRTIPSDARYTPLRTLLGSSRMPDYSGLFMRVKGGSSAALGVVQGDAIRNITGSVVGSGTDSNDEFFGDDSISASGAFAVDNYRYQLGVSNTEERSSNKPHSFNFDASRMVPTANENRPVNIAVRCFMRAVA